MKNLIKSKLLKTILIPTLGITTIAPVVITTSCGEVIRVTDVDLNKKSTMIAIGKSETLTATISPENATDKTVTWSSSDESVASVAQDGTITAKSVGKADIIVTTKDGGKTDTCEVNVKEKIIPVTGVALNKKSLSVYAGDTKTLTATVLPENATDKSVTWSSSDESVASVAQDGTITAKSVGKADIIVTTKDGGFTATCEVEVSSTPTDYVCLFANENSKLKMVNEGENRPNLLYSFDEKDWYPYSDEINISKDQTLFLKGENRDGWSHSYNIYTTLRIDGNVEIGGNIMGLLDNGAKDGDPGNITDIPNDFCFEALFYNSSGITSVYKDLLPSTTMRGSCYGWMFEGCTSLTTAPELPARSLADSCYRSMFDGCSSLVNPPELPATELGAYCYYRMFNNCSSLNSVKIGYTGTVAEAPLEAFSNWVNGVATSGTFYYKGSDTLANFGFPTAPGTNWIIKSDW